MVISFETFLYAEGNSVVQTLMDFNNFRIKSLIGALLKKLVRIISNTLFLSGSIDQLR